jgi:hypothetical protein
MTEKSNHTVEIIIPLENGRAPAPANRAVCQRHRLGWMKVNRETKLEWPGPTLRCRDRNAVAYALICGPEDLIGKLVNEIAECCIVALAAATLTAIIGNPAGAKAAFWAAFSECMRRKIGDAINQVSVELEVNSETTDWGRC